MKTTAELLKEYKDLHDCGALSDEEFAELKKQLLAKGNQEYQEKTDISKPNAGTPGNKVKKEPAFEKPSSDTSGASNNPANNRTNTQTGVDAGTWGCLIAILAIVVFIFIGCSSMLSDSGGSSSMEYETYYQDDNGNGQLDRGEWNWTQDSDGNVVDIDNDGSNWE